MEGRDLSKYTPVPYRSARMSAPMTVERGRARAVAAPLPRRMEAAPLPSLVHFKTIIRDPLTNIRYLIEPYTFSTDVECLNSEVFSYTGERFGFSADMHGTLGEGRVNVVLGLDCNEGTQTQADLPPTLKLRAIREFCHLPLN